MRNLLHCLSGLVLMLLALSSTPSAAQQGLCTFRSSNPSAGCIPVTASAPLPVSGSISITFPTIGAAVPSTGLYNGINVSGTLRGQTGVNPSGSIYAVQTDVASIAGTTAVTGSGTATGALRVELPTNGTGKVGLNAGSAIIGSVGIDQTTPGTTNLVAAGQSGTWTVQPGNTANTTPWLVTGSGSAGTAASGVLTVQGIASMTPLLANPGTAANWGVVATGAAPAANVVQMGTVTSGATGGLMTIPKTCDSHAKYDASTSGSTTMVTGVSGRKVYICGFILATGGTATNVKLREGSDANCASNAADLTPAYQLSTNDRVGALSPFWTGLVVSTNAYYVCVNASAGNAVQAEVWYTIQ